MEARCPMDCYGQGMCMADKTCQCLAPFSGEDCNDGLPKEQDPFVTGFDSRNDGDETPETPETPENPENPQDDDDDEESAEITDPAALATRDQILWEEDQVDELKWKHKHVEFFGMKTNICDAALVMVFPTRCFKMRTKFDSRHLHITNKISVLEESIT